MLKGLLRQYYRSLQPADERKKVRCVAKEHRGARRSVYWKMHSRSQSLVNEPYASRDRNSESSGIHRKSAWYESEVTKENIQSAYTTRSLADNDFVLSSLVLRRKTKMSYAGVGAGSYITCTR